MYYNGAITAIERSCHFLECSMDQSISFYTDGVYYNISIIESNLWPTTYVLIMYNTVPINFSSILDYGLRFLLLVT